MTKIPEAMTLKRSVESLEQIYAFVVALAVAEAVRATFLVEGELTFTVSWLPVFVAFVFTAVPFFHGMNRHLDRCYVERRDEHLQGTLLADFAVFFVEAAVLFAFAASVRSGTDGFLILAVLLLLDTIWALISHWIHYRDVEASTKRWAVINAVTVAAIVLVYFLELYAEPTKAWILAVLAVGRTIVDYSMAWGFYFPSNGVSEA